METPKVCRGCFREWEAGNAVCPRCGWEPGRKYEDVLGWRTGDVFEKRYLLGMPYCRISDGAVWRIYDTVLGIGCLVLRVITEEEESPLYLLAARLAGSAEPLQNQVRLMAIKPIDNKSVLLFSIEEQEKSAEALKKVLGEKERTEARPDIRRPPVSAQEREQALTPGTMLDGRYQILECIGVGGFGIIYLCWDLPLLRLVAVKEYFPAEWAAREEQYVTVKKSQMLEAYRFGMKSFYQEARIMARFIHTPHVVTIYDVLEANDTAYLVMDYIPGISIGREMRKRGYQPYAPAEALEILLPAAEALSAFHEEKIVHSDISPGNIMRSEKGEIFLIDMGAAKYMRYSRPVLSAAFLKLEYAAPEQYRTAKEGIPKDEGPWTDVYALGATIYYLLTGRKPPDVMQRLSGKKPEVSLPVGCRLKHKKRWARLINRAMALDMRERIGSAEELGEELRKLVE